MHLKIVCILEHRRTSILNLLFSANKLAHRGFLENCIILIICLKVNRLENMIKNNIKLLGFKIKNCWQYKL